MSDELIESYVDRAKFSSDTKFATEEIEKVLSAFKSLNSAKANITPDKPLPDISAATRQADKDTQALIKTQTQLATSKKAQIQLENEVIKQIALEEKANQEALKTQKLVAQQTDAAAKSQTDLQKAQEKGNALKSEDAVATQKQILLNQQQAKANKDIAQSALGLIDEYGQLKKTYDAAAASAKNLSAIALKTGDAGDQSAAAGATAQAKALHDQLLQIETGVGQAQRNVGNYTGAIKVLQGALAEATAKLNSLSEAEQQNTQAGQKLQSEVALLGTLVGQQEAGFVSLKREIANSTQALAALENAGLQGTEAFKELQSEVSDAKRELNEFNKQQALLASESPKIAALTTVAKGLGAAYAIGAGSAALLADGNEEVAKELNKLVAVMTLLQGLTEFNAVLSERFAIATALSATKTQLLNAAMKVQAAFSSIVASSTQAKATALTEEAAASEAATAAISEQAAASGAAVVTNGELAASTVAVDAALVGEAGAAGVAAEATTTFATALIATGIGAAVVAIAAAVVYLIVKMEDYNAAAVSQIKANEDLKTSLGELVAATKEFEAVRSASAQQELKDIQNLVEQRKAAGVTALQSLALDKQVAQQKLKTANDDVARYNITKETLLKSQEDAQKAADIVKISEQNKRAYIQQTSELQDKNYEHQIEIFDKNIKRNKEEANTSKAIFDFANENYQKQADARNQIDLIATQEAKLNADERRKLILESARIEADITTAKNSYVLSNEISTLDERLAAIKSNAAEQRKVVQAELNDTLNDPTKSDVDKNLAIKKAGADRVKITEETDKAIFDQNDAARKRELAAQLDFNTISLNADKATQERILANQFSTVKNKVDAVTKAREDQQNILDAQFKHTIETTKLNDTELTALDADYKAKTVANTYDTEQKIKAIQQKATEDYIAMLQRRQAIRLSDANDQVDIGANNTSIDILGDAQLQIEKANGEKRVSLERELQKELSEVDKQAALDKLKIQADEFENEKLAEELGYEDTVNIEKKITDNQKAQAILRKSISDDEYKDAKEKREKELGLIKEFEEASLDAIQAVVDGTIQSQKDKLTAQQDANDKQAARDIELVNASTRSEADKAAAITIIQARAAQQKAALDKQQAEADYRKAKFDKEIAILKIVAQIAIDIAEFNYIAAALAGIALIKLIATPIPKYRHGKNIGDKYAGPAIVNDGPADEVIERADGSIEFPQGRNVLTQVASNDIVHPDRKEWEDAARRAAHRDLRTAMSFTPAKSSGPDIGKELQKQNQLLTKIANKAELSLAATDGGMVALHKWGARQVQYVQENTNW